jgi:hypothetical protein
MGGDGFWVRCWCLISVLMYEYFGALLLYDMI